MSVDHHAHLYRSSSFEATKTALKEAYHSTHEVLLVEKLAWGIDDSRDLIEEAFRTAYSGQSRVILVSFASATVEAQNALLKILEEPPQKVLFLFVVSPTTFLLPTILSRFFEHPIETAESSHDAFTQFATLGLKERLETIDKKLKAKETEWLEAMRQGVLTYLARTDKVRVSPSARQWLLIANHLGGRGASNKMLLELLALLLP